MPSDFAEVGKTLEDALSVPDLPLESIRSGARAARMRQHWRVVVVTAFAAIIALASGTVLAAKVFGFQMWLYGNRVAMMSPHSLTIYRGPDETTVRHVISNATFPVVFPVGLPSGERVLRLVVTPADHPSAILIQYHKNGERGYTLIDSSLVQNGTPPQLPGIASVPLSKLHYWRVGSEVVVSPNPAQWPKDAAVKAAMLRATPQGSLAQTISRLYRITALGGFLSAANRADAIAPSDGRSTLVDRGHLREVPTLVRSHKVLFTTRATTIDHIGTSHGKADFGHASLHPGPQELAVSANGVRAISAVLATNVCGRAPKFTCEMLINERSGMPYRIWALPIRSAQTAQQYVVDPETFHVGRAQ